MTPRVQTLRLVVGRPHALVWSGQNLSAASKKMSLVLAIESDAGQAGQLANIAQQLRVELIVVKSTGEALKALGRRAPDLVLVPALLSPKEDATLADTLRTVAGNTPVRLLIKPLLSSGKTEATGGLMANLRKRKRKPAAVPDGCDPATFAEQMAVYLGEANAPTPPMPAAVVSPVAPPAPTIIKPHEPPAPSLVKPVTESVAFAPAADPVPLVKPEPVVAHAHRAEPWPLAASSLVVNPLPPAEPPVTNATELPVWPSLESLLSKAAEPSSVEEATPSPAEEPMTWLVEQPTPSLVEESPSLACGGSARRRAPPREAMDAGSSAARHLIRCHRGGGAGSDWTCASRCGTAGGCSGRT